MRFVFLALLAMGLSGCGAWERGVAGVTGYSRVCVSGVSYLQFVSGVTVEYRPDGGVIACK